MQLRRLLSQGPFGWVGSAGCHTSKGMGAIAWLPSIARNTCHFLGGGLLVSKIVYSSLIRSI